MQLAISSWSVHGLLGQVWYEPDADGRYTNRNEPKPTSLSLLELPAFAAEHGIPVVEICHFHFPATDDHYLAELQAALEAAGITLANVLIDSGNLSSLDDAQWRADIEFNKRWQDVAAKVGARGVRIDCGTEPATPETIKRSADALRELSDYGGSLELETTTENWRQTSIHPADLLEIMDQTGRSLKLCVDFGNAEKTGDKFATLKALLPHGTSLHCKGHFDGLTLDVDEFKQGLELVRLAGFDGHVALITDGTEHELEKILILKEMTEKFL